MTQLQAQPKRGETLTFQRNRWQDVPNTVAIAALICTLGVIPFLIAGQQDRKAHNDFLACIDMAPLFSQGGPVTSCSEESADNTFLYALGIIAFVCAAVYLVYVVSKLLRPNVYTFDQHSNLLNLDGKKVAQLSDITDVKVMQHSGLFSVEAVYGEDGETRLSTYRLSGQANDLADQIAEYLNAPKTHGADIF